MHLPRLLLLSLAGLLACGRTDPLLMAKGPAKFRGLWTSPNEFSAPEGSLETADNVTFDRYGILEPRRGYEALSASVSGTINSMIWWRGHLFVHHGTTSLSRWNGSSWTAISGTWNPPDANTRVRFYVAQGSLFFLTSAGVYEVDAPTATPRLTGSPGALDSTATLRRTSNETGFATADGQYAYRVVWGRINANRRLQLGRTSGRFLVQNPANVTATAANISKAGTAVVTVINTTHGFATGEYVDVDLQGTDANFAEGRFQVTVLSSTSFTYNDGGAAVVATSTVNIVYGFTSRNVNLSIPIPSGITTSDFVQVYRSAKSASATSEPSDSLGQVYERAPTNLEITAGVMTITDISFDEIRGAEIYISTDARQELAQKDRPPLCNDLAEFRDVMWFACTQELHALDIHLLSVGGATGLQLDEGIEISDKSDTNPTATWFTILIAKTVEDLANGEFQLYTSGTASQNIANTAKSLVRAINANTGNASNPSVYASYQSGPHEAPGLIRIYARTPSVGAFVVVAVPAGSTSAPDGSMWIPRLTGAYATTSLSRSGSTVTVDLGANHNFAMGQQVTLLVSPADASFPSGVKTIASIVDANTFTYTEAGPTDTNTDPQGVYDQPLNIVQSFNSDFSNGLMWSDPDQPWSVPLIHLHTFGPDTHTALRLVPTRDRLLVMVGSGAEQRTYQVTGTFPNWSFDEFDLTAGTVAYNTVVPISGRVAGLLNQGVGLMADSVGIISTPIDKTIRDLRASADANVRARAFGVGYEEDRKYLLFLPTSSAATGCDNAFVYHLDTNDWTRWTIANVTSAAVNDADGKLYLGRSDGSVWAENKARAGATDYYDTSFAVTVSVVNSSTSCDVVSAAGISVGDTLKFSTGDEVLITGINGSTLTHTEANDPDGGPGTIYKHFTVTVEPLAFTGGEADSQKLFTNGVLLAEEANYTGGVTLSFRTDLNPTASSPFNVTPPVATTGARSLDFEVPPQWQRGSRLSMTLAASHARQKLTLMGYTQSYQTERPGRTGR